MYQLYMDDILFPITPESIQTKIKNQNKTVSLINEGEASVLKLPGLTELEFDLRLPQQKYPFAIYENNKFKDAFHYLETLATLKEERKNFLFRLVRMRPDGMRLFDTEMTVSLEEYAIKESASDGMDLTVSVKLKEFRPFQTKLLVTISGAKTGKGKVVKAKAREAKQPVKSYTVKKGDSLWKICAKELGNGNKCWEIAKKNKIKNPNLIYPGQVIKF